MGCGKSKKVNPGGGDLEAGTAQPPPAVGDAVTLKETHPVREAADADLGPPAQPASEPPAPELWAPASDSDALRAILAPLDCGVSTEVLRRSSGPLSRPPKGPADSVPVSSFDRVEIGLDALGALLGRWDAQQPAPGVTSTELRETLRRVAWHSRLRGSYTITRAHLREAAETQEEYAILWSAAKSGKLEFLAAVPDRSESDDEAVAQFIHAAFVPLLCGDYLSDALQRSSKEEERELVREMKPRSADSRWADIFLATHELLLRSAPDQSTTNKSKRSSVSTTGGAQRWARLISSDNPRGVAVLLHAACEADCVYMAEMLLDATAGQSLLDSFDPTGRSALFKAALAGREEFCKALLARGANVELASRLQPELEVVKGNAELVESQRCEVDAGNRDSDRFLVALASTPIDESGAWMYEVTIERPPRFVRSVTQANFEVDVDCETRRTTYAMDWSEFSVGWMRAANAKHDKKRGDTRMTYETIPGRGKQTIGLGPDGRCRVADDRARNMMFKHCKELVSPLMDHEAKLDLDLEIGEHQPEQLPALPSLEEEGEALFGGSLQAGDVVGVAVIPVNPGAPAGGRRFYFALNGEWALADKTAGVERLVLIPCAAGVACGAEVSFNFGQRPFRYPPPPEGGGQTARPIVEAIEGDTPIEAACRRGHLSIVEAMLPNIVDLETLDRRHSRTPLLWAAWWGWPEVARDLAQRGANLAAVDVNKHPLLRHVFLGWSSQGRQGKHPEVLANFALPSTLSWDHVASSVNDVHHGLTSKPLVEVPQDGGPMGLSLCEDNFAEAQEVLQFLKEVPSSVDKAPLDVKTLTLTGLPLNEATLGLALTYAPDAERITVSSCRCELPEDAGKILSSLLSRAPQLRELHLFSCGFNGRTVSAFAEALEEQGDAHMSLETLRWKGNPLAEGDGPQAAGEALDRLCANFPSLKYLGLRDTRLRREHVDDLPELEDIKIWL